VDAVGIFLEIGAFAGGFLGGFGAAYLLGDGGAVLLPFFLSATRELNPFWLGYVIGAGAGHAVVKYSIDDALDSIENKLAQLLAALAERGEE